MMVSTTSTRLSVVLSSSGRNRCTMGVVARCSTKIQLALPFSAATTTTRFHDQGGIFGVTTVRHHSTIPGESSGGAAAAATTTSSTSTFPKLQHVRSFPVIGSMIPQLSGVPDTFLQAYSFWPEMRRRHGDFYTIGLPALNTKDWYGTIHVVCDPKQMVQVIKAGGAYPSGLVESLWVSKKHNAQRGTKVQAILSNGPEWKRLRTFMQKDLLHPDSARSYVPGMIRAAQLASAGAPFCTANLNDYMKRFAFDLFASTVYGEMTQVSNPNTFTDPNNERFVTATAGGLSTSIEMLMDPKENIMNMLGYTSAKCKFCFEAFDESWDVGMQKIENFTERKNAGLLNVDEQNSYLYRAIDRQKEPDSQVTLREAQELTFSGIFAAIDTTASVMGWNVFHVARSPHVQEKLYEEVKAAVDKFGSDGDDDGKLLLTPEALAKTNVPYLHAVIREAHRLTPPGTNVTTKRVDNDNVTIYGTKMKQGDVVTFDAFSIGIDPEFVEDPDEFVPERWLPDAVEARKGTPSEVIDHPFMKEPFSQGARKCPAARVAINELQVMLAQLVLDWKISSPVTVMKDIKYNQRSALELEIPELQFVPRN